MVCTCVYNVHMDLCACVYIHAHAYVHTRCDFRCTCKQQLDLCILQSVLYSWYKTILHAVADKHIQT